MRKRIKSRGLPTASSNGNRVTKRQNETNSAFFMYKMFGEWYKKPISELPKYEGIVETKLLTK